MGHELALGIKHSVPVHVPVPLCAAVAVAVAVVRCGARRCRTAAASLWAATELTRAGSIN